MSSYKLSYFDIRGKSEIIRLIFAQAGVEYEDNRIGQNEWREHLKRSELSYCIRNKIRNVSAGLVCNCFVVPPHSVPVLEILHLPLCTLFSK